MSEYQRYEFMTSDLRALYIVWLASQRVMESVDEDKDDEDEISVPPIPPALGTLTAAQQALSELLQVPHEVLIAAARHSSAAPPSMPEDVAAWVMLLPPNRRTEYLVRLARHEPGLSRLLVKELRELSQNDQDKSRATRPTGEHVTTDHLNRTAKPWNSGRLLPASLFPPEWLCVLPYEEHPNDLRSMLIPQKSIISNRPSTLVCGPHYSGERGESRRLVPSGTVDDLTSREEWR